MNPISFAWMSAVMFVISACSDRPEQVSRIEFDAAHSVALEGTIPEGTILSRSTDDSQIEGEIRQQLFYTMGQLNGEDGVADLNRTKVSVGQKIPIEGRSGWYEVSFAAQLFVAWPKEVAVPGSYQLVLPESGDYARLQRFFETYRNTCADHPGSDVTNGNFWYYYRPLKYNCPLKEKTSGDQTVRLKMQLSVSEENTIGKSPEYQKVWEDGRLVVTAIFGKNEVNGDESDPGVAAYNELFNKLVSIYGWPKDLSVPINPGEEIGTRYDDVVAKFQLPQGELDIALFLVPNLYGANSDFVRKYNARTINSDFVSYSGHSGLGANIRRLTDMGDFVKGQYQLFLVNGCDTFAYVANNLRDAHASANPEAASPDKYFDIITNAMPSYFHMNAHSNITIINALVGKTKTYRKILNDFDISQRAVVTGEQDNRFPEPFDD